VAGFYSAVDRLRHGRIAAAFPDSTQWLEAVADPNHPNHAEAKEWLDEYDPKVIDELSIKYALSRIASRRNAAKTRLANNKQTPSTTE
jgi:hypothetical protein